MMAAMNMGAATSSGANLSPLLVSAHPMATTKAKTNVAEHVDLA